MSIIETHGTAVDAQSLSADVLLYGLLGGIDALAAVPAWLCYAVFALGMACLIAFFVVKSKYSEFIAQPHSSGAKINLSATLIAFGLGHLMNAGYQDLMTTNNPIFWVPLALFCVSRALSFLFSVLALVLPFMHAFTGYPHKKICQAVTENANRLNEYIDSGRYQKSDDILREIASYSVCADFDRLAEIHAKLEELEKQKRELIRMEESEFLDKSAEKTALDVRIGKARAKIKELTH